MECRRAPARFPSDQAFWKRIWAHRILGRSERDQFRQLRSPEPRQLEWLAGRAAAKEAIRALLRTQYGLDILPADVEIYPDEWGRPHVAGGWRGAVPGAVAISIAHTDGVAVALAGVEAPGAGGEASSLRLGIDVERVRDRPEGFAELAFTAGEQELLATVPPGLRLEWTLRSWCAKEAVAKASGYGLIEGPRSVEVMALDIDRELIAVRLANQLAAAHPDLADSPLVVYTGRDGDLVVATTLCEPAGTGAAARSVGYASGEALLAPVDGE
jgi:phosphopantetheinyl transferase